MYSYENDPDLFMFDYREDLLQRATNRERVFTLNKFVEPDEDDEQAIEKLNRSMENRQRSNKLINLQDEDQLAQAEVMKGSMRSSGRIGSVKSGQEKGVDSVVVPDGESSDDYDPKPERQEYPTIGVQNKFGI